MAMDFDCEEGAMQRKGAHFFCFVFSAGRGEGQAITRW